MELAVTVLEQVARLEGLPLGEGGFGPGPALWVGGREVAHVDAGGALDVRLTRPVIRDRRAGLKADPRITLRPSSSSDWLEAAVADAADVDWAVALVRDAVAANR